MTAAVLSVLSAKKMAFLSRFVRDDGGEPGGDGFLRVLIWLAITVRTYAAAFGSDVIVARFTASRTARPLVLMRTFVRTAGMLLVVLVDRQPDDGGVVV